MAWHGRTRWLERCHRRRKRRRPVWPRAVGSYGPRTRPSTLHASTSLPIPSGHSIRCSPSPSPLEIGTLRRDVSTSTLFSLIKGLILDGKNRTQLRPRRPRALGPARSCFLNQQLARIMDTYASDCVVCSTRARSLLYFNHSLNPATSVKIRLHAGILATSNMKG
jgi:hypothetical protein